MTGTSLDGIDCALVKFYVDNYREIKFDLIDYNFTEYNDEVKQLISKIIEEPIPVSLLSDFNVLLSHIYADSINSFLDKVQIPLDKLNAIGIHGQTIWHSPNAKNFFGYRIASTYQIASISTLAALLGVPVIGDFRSNDIALGGQGAPLVPIFDYSFLASKEYDVIALNIGGIANITYLPRGCSKNDVIAFDTGVGNIYIDLAANDLFGKSYDKEGLLASQGKLIDELFDKLKNLPFTYEKPPKSTGREYFSKDLYNKLINDLINKYPAYDIIHTFTYFTAWSIAYNIKEFSNPTSKIIVSGGGALNNCLMSMLKEFLPDAIIITSEDIGIPIEAKEAICFAYLACLRMLSLPANLPSVTGASRESVLGVLALP